MQRNSSTEDNQIAHRKCSDCSFLAVCFIFRKGQLDQGYWTKLVHSGFCSLLHSVYLAIRVDACLPAGTFAKGSQSGK